MKHSNKSSGWTLCPSKTLPGKFYYFNVLTGETVWSGSDSEKQSFNKHPNTNHPEPSNRPDGVIINTPIKNGISNNFISAPRTMSTQELYISNSNMNKNMSYVDNPNSNDLRNPLYISNPKNINDLVKPPDYTIRSNLTESTNPHCNPTDLVTHCTPALSVTTSSRLPSIKLVMPTSWKTIDNAPQYIWAPIPIEYVYETQFSGKTSQANAILTEGETRPNTDKLLLIKKLNHNFNCNNTYNTDSTRQSSLSPNTKPKIIRKIVKIPELESKISCNKGFSCQDVKPKKKLFQSDEVDNKQDNLDNLIENNLRSRVVKRKMEMKNNGVPDKKIRSDPQTTLVIPKKKVTFNLTDKETIEEYQEEPEQPKNPVLLKLRQLGAIDNTEWYIVVDSNVVLESFDFINSFIQDDPLCKLAIPYSVYYSLLDTSTGNSHGQTRVQHARVTLRRINVAAKSNHVIVERLTGLNERFLPQMDQIQKYCLKLMLNEKHVVLITNSNILYYEAVENGILVFKIAEIKNVSNETSKLLFDIKKSITSVSNDNCLTKKAVHYNTTSNFSNPDLNCDRTNVPNSNSERVQISDSEKIRYKLFGEEKSVFTKENNNSNLTDLSNLSDISECSLISTNIQEINEIKSIYENPKSTPNNEKTGKVEQEKKEFKIPNFENFIIQKEVLNKETKDTQFKNTREKEAQLKFTRVNDTDQNVIQGNGNTFKGNTQLNDIGENDTHLKVTKDKQPSVTVIERNLMPVTNKTIEDKLKTFYIKNKIIQENLEKRNVEYFCSFRQILEGFYDIIKDFSNVTFNINKIWSLYDVLQVFTKNGDKSVKLLAEKIINILYEYDYQGAAKMKMSLKPDDLMQIIGCGILLVQQLKVLKTSPELLEMENDLDYLVHLIENPEEIGFDLIKPDVPQNNTIQKNIKYIKPRKEIVDYLKKNYSQWKDYEENETDEALNMTQKPSNVKIVRTLGNKLNLIKLNRHELITEKCSDNAESKPTNNPLETEKNSLNNQIVISNTEPIRSLNKIAQENDRENEDLNETKDGNTNGTNLNEEETFSKYNLVNLDFSELSDFKSSPSITTDGAAGNMAQINNNEKDDLKRNIMFYSDDIKICLNNKDLTKTIGLKTGTLVNQRTATLKDNSKNTSFVNDNSNKTSAQIDERPNHSKYGRDRNSLLIEDSTRAIVEDKKGTDSLSTSVSILNNYQNDNINLEKYNIKFVKSFLMEIHGSIRLIIKFSEKSLRELQSDNLKETEGEFIKNNAIKIKKELNEMGKTLQRLIIYVELTKEGTNSSLFSKDNTNKINYRDLLHKCLEQVNSVADAVDLILHYK